MRNPKRDANETAMGPISLVVDRLRSRIGWLLFASAVMVMGAFAANVPAWLSGVIVDQVIKGDVTSFDKAMPYLIVLLATFIVREVAVLARKFAVERTACELERDELIRLSKFLLRIDLSAFWGQRIGGLNVRIHRSLEGLIKLVKLVFMDLTPTVVYALVALLMASQKSLLVVGLMTAIFAAALVLTLIQVATQRGIRIALFKAKEDVSANLTEVLLGLDYVRASGGMSEEEGRTRALAAQLRDQEFRHHKWMMTFDGGKQLLEGLGLVLILGVGAWQVGQGTISKGDVLALALLYAAVAAPLRELHRIIDEGFEGLLKVRELVGLYAMPADPGLPGHRPLSTDSRPIVQTRGLSFALPGRQGAAELLKAINLSVQPNEWLGIAGSSGCGKSTLLKIILGLSANYVGSACVSGVEVSEALKADLWDKVAYVGQSPHIIKGTVRSNLRYGMSTSPSDTELMVALDLAGLKGRFSVATGACLDVEIEEQGRNLSGGEKQRLAIARLFVRQPSLIILDEATSALDYENEWRLIQNLRRRFSGVAALVVAHRLEALRETDKIIVMRSGSIVEEGTFASLSNAGGEFTKIANLAHAA